jgi:hypothetical protein
LLVLVEVAADAALDLKRFIGSFEGVIAHRRDFRLDIDVDGDNEIVSLVDTRPVLRRGHYEDSDNLIPVVLDMVDGKLRRIPTERASANTMDGPLRADLLNITGSTRPDLVASWMLGENSVGFFIYRWECDRYVLVKNKHDESCDVMPHPGGCGFYNGGIYLVSNFGDFDGDGHYEVEVCEMVGDESQLLERGYSLDDPLKRQPIVTNICSVWKWDPCIEMMIPIDETAPVSGWQPPGTSF